MTLMNNLQVLTSLLRMSVEEAARFGRPAADVEHLFLALTLTDTAAGQLLRNQGATYDASLAAIRSIESDALESVGITAPTSLRPADPTTTNGLTDRASRIFKAKSGPDYLAFLEALLAEPSGTIVAILGRLGIDVEEVRAGVASAEGHTNSTEDHAGSSLNASATMSCPARFDVVGEYLSDAENTTTWEPSLAGRILVADAGTAASWTAPPPEDGTRSKARCAIRVIMESSSSDRISWRFEPIGFPRANITHVTFTLIPDGEVTTVQTDLRFTPTKRRPRHRLLRWAACPLARLHAEAISGAVNKNFRP